MRIALHWRILIGLGLGLAVGLLLNAFWTVEVWAQLGVGKSGAYLKGIDDPGNAGAGTAAAAARGVVNLVSLIGDLFIRCLKAVAVPIVLCSLIVGAAALGDLRTLGRIGGKTLVFFFGTTAFAAVLGLILAGAVKPGAGIAPASQQALVEQQGARVAEMAGNTARLDSFWSFVRNLVPTNVFDALVRADMLQVILIALAIGIALTRLRRERAAPVLGFFEGLGDAVTLVVQGLMWVAPAAVFCMIAGVAATMGVDVLRALGKYCLVVALGLSLLLFVEYPVLLKLLAGAKIGAFFRAVAPAQLMALSTSSSSATLPVTMECVRTRLGVSERVTSFVCPLGATVNMDGTAMYQAMATMFIAQMSGIELSVAQQATVAVLATLASVGAPGIPSGGIVLLIAVLGQVGVPTQGVAVVLAVDAILDRLRTVVNVSGDAMAALIIERSEGGQPRAEESA